MVAVAAALWAGKRVLLIVFAGLVFSVALNLAANWIAAKLHCARWLALTLVVVLLLTAASAASFFLAPHVGDQLAQVAEQFPGFVQQTHKQLEQYRWGRFVLQHAPAGGDVAAKAKWLLGQIAAAFYGLLGILANIVLIFFIGVYLAANPGLYKRGLVCLVPVPKRAAASRVLGDAGDALGRWLLAKLSLMCVVGVLTALGLWLLGLPLILSLALLAAALDFVPNIGPIASAVPAILLGLMQGPMHAVYVGLLYLGVQLLESYILAPLVQRKAVQLAPALLLSSQVLLAALLGLPGLLLATPITVVALVITREVYVKRFLEQCNS